MDIALLRMTSPRLASTTTPILAAVAALGLAACAASQPYVPPEPSMFGNPGMRPGPDFFDPQFYGGVGI